MKNFRILIDMDEVVCDFMEGACRAWGTTRAAVEKHWPPGKWDMVPPLSKTILTTAARRDWLVMKCGIEWFEGDMSQDLFWTRLNGSEDFWLGLEPTPWLDDLVRLVELYTDDWHIISAPSCCNSSYSGKVKWLKRQFGQTFDRFCLTPHKHLFAGPNVILIDDRDSNIEAFVAAGGRGIVFPRLHNSQHVFKDYPLKYVAASLEVECASNITERQHCIQGVSERDHEPFDPDFATH